MNCGAKVRISERNAKEKHIFFCFSEREYLWPEVRGGANRVKYQLILIICSTWLILLDLVFVLVFLQRSHQVACPYQPAFTVIVVRHLLTVRHDDARHGVPWRIQVCRHMGIGPRLLNVVVYSLNGWAHWGTVPVWVWKGNESSMKSYSQMKRSTLPVWSPQTREKGQQNQESSQLDQRDKSTKSVQETVINKTVSNQGSKGVNTIQGKTGKSHG